MSIEELYLREGIRLEYHDLSEEEKNAVKKKKRKLAKEIYLLLKEKIVNQVIDNNAKIEIHFTRSGINHFCNDVMLTLSGKYFTEESLKSVDTILSRSSYIPTVHISNHSREDGRYLWFTYKDTDGIGIFFKVDKQTRSGLYELYSIVDKISEP